jgi:hypothetical protein
VRVALLLPLLVACGPPEEESGFCARSRVDPGPTPVGRVVAGDGSAGAFVPWADGATVPLIFGFQGGVMVTPVLEVEAGPPPGPDGVCWLVAIDNRIASGPSVADYEDTYVFFPDGGRYYTDAIPDFLGEDPDPLIGNELVLDITVTGRDFEATGAVTIVLGPDT